MIKLINLPLRKSAIMALFFLVSTQLNALSFDESVSIRNPVLVQTGIGKNWCSVSGENLLEHYKTNHIVTLVDGTKKQYASMRFLAQDWPKISQFIDTIEVIDAKTETPISAKTAFYVVNSKANTSFTKFSKIAFGNKEDAKEFTKKFKGSIRPFDFVLFVASQDIPQDQKYTKTKKTRDYRRGSKIFELVCQELDPNDFDSLTSLKKHIVQNNICVNLNEEDLQDLALYLYEVKRFGELKVFASQIEVPKESKCPVCGMFVAKYPKWVGLIKHNGHDFYFDGAKDMFKFYFDPKRYYYEEGNDFNDVFVTDYYSLQQLVASEAWYVLGSNVYGPMGHELIPFETKEKAIDFAKEHSGEEVISFKEITNKKVWALDQ